MTTAETIDLRYAFWQLKPQAHDTEPAAGEDEGGDHDQPAEWPEDVRRYIKRANAEGKRHRKKIKAESKRADAAEGQLREARLALAFTRANLDRPEPFKDVDVALGLADLTDVMLSEDGDAAGLQEAMDALAERYPYLVDDSEPAPDEDDEDDEPLPKSGRAAGLRKPGPQANRAALNRKFPALRNR